MKEEYPDKPNLIYDNEDHTSDYCITLMHFILAQTYSLLPSNFLTQMFYDIPDPKKNSTSGRNYSILYVCTKQDLF